jgi:hypothetical protein
MLRSVLVVIKLPEAWKSLGVVGVGNPIIRGYAAFFRFTKALVHCTDSIIDTENFLPSPPYVGPLPENGAHRSQHRQTKLGMTSERTPRTLRPTPVAVKSSLRPSIYSKPPRRPWETAELSHRS